MFVYGGLNRNPFRFLITPNASLVVSDVWFPLSDSRVPAAFWNFVRSDGGDIRVLAQDGVTQLPFELVGFNSTTKVGSLFIKVGSATAFYVYFGNRQWVALAVGSTYGKYAVWESAAKVVAHLEDATDSTVNQNNLTNTGMAYGAVQMQNGALGDSTHYLSIPCNAGLVGMSSFTLSCWAQRSTVNFGFFGRWGTPGNVYLFRTTAWQLQLFVNTVNGSVTNNSSLSIGTGKHLCCATYDGANICCYLDGTAGTQTAQTGAVNSTATGNIICAAAYDATTPIDGNLDELRILSRAYSQAEISQHFANQNAPGTFWHTVGALEQV